jgi:hypothetical protein
MRQRHALKALVELDRSRSLWRVLDFSGTRLTHDKNARSESAGDDAAEIWVTIDKVMPTGCAVC